MSKVWDKPITADTDWGGDASTDNLPVSGRQVQAWIKGNIKNDDAISLLIAKWLNEHTTNSITFWKGLPIDSGSLKWVDEHLTVIGGTGGSETPQDLPFIYDPVKKAWEFKGDFVVTGAITMFGSLSGFQPSTVTEAVEVDGETIVKTKNSQGQWQLTAIGGGSGSGGGISAAEVNILIENALKPYIKIETADDKYALISTVSGINSRLSAVETFFATEDSDTLINKWSEIVAFLNATEGDTLDNILATKANQSALDAAVASLTTEIGKKWTQNDAKISNWDSAYGWGDHANAGYAAKTYVDAELAKYVKLATAQSIEAQHNFVNGLQIGGLPITKSASANNTIYLDANLVVSGAITMFGSGSTTFPTIWANIPFDLNTMEWTGSVWRVKDGGTGSVDEATVNNLIYEYLTKNSYARISDISSALMGYATQTWVGDTTAKYLGAASVDSARHAIGYDNLSMGSTNLPLAGGFISADQGKYGFQLLGSTQGNRLFVRSLYNGAVGTWSEIASQSWVGDNYLSKSGGTITIDGIAGFTIYRNNGVYSAIHFYNTQDGTMTDVGYLGAVSNGRPVYLDAGGSVFDLIHSGNIGQQSVSRAASAGAADSVSVTPVTESGNYSLALLPSSSTRTQGVCVGNNHRALFNPSTGALTATSFVGNLMGNANTATKLQTARTIWGQSFDGSGDINGIMSGVSTIHFGSNQYGGPGIYQGNWYSSALSGGDVAFYFAKSVFEGSLTVGGVATPLAKFHVAGTGFVTEHFSVGANLAHANADRAELSIVSQGDSPTDLMFGYSGTRKWSISSRSATSTVAKSIGLFNYEADAWAWVVDVNNNIAIGGTETGSCKLRISTTRSDTFSWVLGDLASKSDFALDFIYGAECYGLYAAINYRSGDVGLQVGRSDGETAAYNLVLNPLGGNIAIGGTTADAKLHIHGNAKIGAIYLERSNEINVYDGDKTVYLNYASSGNVAMCIGGGNVTIGETTVSEKFNVQGNVLIKGGDNPYLLIKDHQDRNWYIQYYKDYISLGAGFANSVKIDSIGNLIAPGAITMFSQLSMKNVIDYDGLSLEQLAQIKPARFTWKDGRDTLVHAGGIADEVMQVLPEVVHRTKDDKLTMDYGSAGFFMAASLIKPVIDHEQRLQSAEKEIKDLREENKRLIEQLRAS